MEHLKGVPRGVSGAEEQRAAGNRLPAFRPFHRDGRHRAVFNGKIGEFRFKADVRSQRKKLRTQIFQHHMERVGSHMGFCVNEDILRRTAAHQHEGQHTDQYQNHDRNDPDQDFFVSFHNKKTPFSAVFMGKLKLFNRFFLDFRGKNKVL